MTSLNDKKIAEHLKKYWKGELSKEEEAELKRWLASSQENRQLFEQLNGHDVNNLNDFADRNPGLNLDKFFNAQQPAVEPAKKEFSLSKVACWVFAAAAVIVVCMLIPFSGFLHKPAPTMALHENGVKIKRANGSYFFTDTIQNYLLIEEGDYRLLVHKHELRCMPLPGKLVKMGPKWFNEIIVPARNMFTVILPDESRVNLNALSSFRFPVTGSTGSIRNVELTGEGYFEVKSRYENNKKLPFIVKARTAAGLGIDVTVKGTIFNINAYNESLINTTLLEGHIGVSANGEVVSLSAGEQLKVGAIIRRKKITSDDIINAVSWRDSCFSCINAPVVEVLNEVSNWYGITFELADDFFVKNYTGRLFRSEELESILRQICTAIGCRFTIEGKRVRLIKYL